MRSSSDRRNVPSHGTAHATPLFDVQAYGTLLPGGQVAALPVFRNKYPDNPDEPQYLTFGSIGSGTIQVYDPHHRVLAFGENGMGEVFQVTYDYYANRYVTVGEFGLTRRARIGSTPLVAGESCDATITVEKLDDSDPPEPTAIATIPITIYSWHQGPDIIANTPVLAVYDKLLKRWFAQNAYVPE